MARSRLHKTLGAGLGVLALGLAQAPGPAQASETKLAVMVFPGIQNLAIFAAQSQGFFARHDLDVEVRTAQSGAELRDGLARGDHQIAHGAADQAVSMAEISKVDIEIIMGGDTGFNHLFTQPDIASIADLRGRMLVVDDPDTAYTLQMLLALRQNGLGPNDYAMRKAGGTFKRVEVMLAEKDAAATTLNPPFSLRAAAAGLKDMGDMVKLSGPYQGQSGFVMKSWGNTHAEILVRYIQAYIEALRWAVDARNKDAAVALLVDRLKLTPEIAAQTWQIAAEPASGLAHDAALDQAGFRNVLRLRAELQGQWNGVPPAPERYLNLTYYRDAVAALH